MNAQGPSPVDRCLRHRVAKVLLLRQAPPLREEIAHPVSLPMRAVLNALEGLESEGFVERLGDKSAVGPAYQICCGAAYNVGDLAGKICAKATEATNVRVENDVNLAVLGEVWKGHAIGNQEVGFFSLGVGLGLVVNAKLVRAARGAAGEVVHLPIGKDLTSTSTLDVGAFELEIGSAGILACYGACGGTAAKTVRDIFSLLETGDGVAAATVDEIADKAALAIVALQAMVDLDNVILGGGIGVRPELVQRVRTVMPRLFSRPVDIAASALGNRAELIGAVASATQHLHRRCFATEDLPDANIFLDSSLAGAVA